MDNNEIELVGSPCGYHGPYTFYKAFKYTKNGIIRILSLSEFFFVKLWSDSDLVCIGELQLLWVDKNSDQILASLRLYFLPEHTPEGRIDHGEDEVLAISEKVVLRAEDLLTWITLDADWNWGIHSVWSESVQPPPPLSPNIKTEEQDPLGDCKEDPLALNDPLGDCKDPLSDFSNKPYICTRRAAPALTDSLLDFSDVEKERNILDDSWTKGNGVMVLSYPRYCRYRALMKRLESVEDKWLKSSLVAALGGFSSPCRNTRVLFCKDTFDYPDLEGHELLCNHLAPKLKGRPRGKRKKRSISPGGSESNESESSVSIVSLRTRLTTSAKNGLRCNTTTLPRRSTRSSQSVEERDFLTKLNTFMKTHRTPIGRVPSLGFKEIDLYQFYSKVQKLGGYEKVTSNRTWKQVFDELGGNQGSTSAATITRRHYERLLLPYERSVRGEDFKSITAADRRRLKTSKTSNSSTASASASDSEGSSGTSTPVSSHAQAYSPSQIFIVPGKIRSEGKTSSLRSVRVKPERLREATKHEKCSSTISRLDSQNDIVAPVTPSDTSPSAMLVNIPSPTMSPDSPGNKPSNDKPDTATIKGKENIPVPNTPCNGTDILNSTNSIEEPKEPSPSKSNSPERVENEISYRKPNLLPSIFPEMKKRKLDILKEGGLEVTAVTTDVENRPSVIHQFNIPETLPRKTLDISSMRHLPSTEINRLPQLNVPKPCHLPYSNNQTPPKVIQSRSIYSHSQNTVYGNPKDIDPLMPPPAVPQLPRFIPPRSPAGGEVLDLTVRSPQKPVVEIMRVPSTAARIPKEHPVSTIPGPMFDGRIVGSNLEITLVGAPKTPQKTPPFVQKVPVPSRQPQKRSASGKFMSNRMENGKQPSVSVQPIMKNGSISSNSANLIIPTPPSRNSSLKSDKSKQQSVTNHDHINPAMFPNYLSQLSAIGAKIPYLTLDPLYYSALAQRLYANPMQLAAAFQPSPTAEQLQFYKEFMNFNNHFLLPEGSASITSVGHNNTNNSKN